MTGPSLSTGALTPVLGQIDLDVPAGLLQCGDFRSLLQLLEGLTDAVSSGTTRVSVTASHAMVREGFGLLEIQNNVAFHRIQIKLVFIKRKIQKFHMTFTFWLALLTTCTHSASLRDPTLEKAKRHTAIYRIPSPRSGQR